MTVIQNLAAARQRWPWLKKCLIRAHQTAPKRKLCWRVWRQMKMIIKRALIWLWLYHGDGARAEAIDTLLDLVARNRAWNDDAARKQLVELFDAYGATDELVVGARKRLSSILFS